MPEPQPLQMPSAPPTAPGMLGRGPAPSWPKVVGIVAIVFGAIGTIGGLWGVVSSFISTALIPSSEQDRLLAHLEQWRPWTIASSVLGAALAVLLLASGVGLVGRRRWGLVAARRWAYLKLLLVLVNTAVMVPMTQGQMASMNSGGPTPPPAFMAVLVVIGIVLALIWGSALPVFMLLFLRSASVRAHAESWS